MYRCLFLSLFFSFVIFVEASDCDEVSDLNTPTISQIQANLQVSKKAARKMRKEMVKNSNGDEIQRYRIAATVERIKKLIPSVAHSNGALVQAQCFRQVDLPRTDTEVTFQTVTSDAESAPISQTASCRVSRSASPVAVASKEKMIQKKDTTNLYRRLFCMAIKAVIRDNSLRKILLNNYKEEFACYESLRIEVAKNKFFEERILELQSKLKDVKEEAKNKFKEKELLNAKDQRLHQLETAINLIKSTAEQEKAIMQGFLNEKSQVLAAKDKELKQLQKKFDLVTKAAARVVSSVDLSPSTFGSKI